MGMGVEVHGMEMNELEMQRELEMHVSARQGV